MTRITGKLALITGASSGIGRACARRFAADGCHLVLWARRRNRLDALAAELRGAHGVTADVTALDVRDRAAVTAAAEALAAAGRVPDILLNAAGLAAGLAKLHEGNADDWDRMIDTNVKGLLYVSRAILPLMVGANRGHVVNLGSIAGQQVYPMGNVYNASKFAVRALNLGMAVDLLGTNVRVTSIDPGLVETEFSVVRFGGDAERAKSVYQGFEPLTGEDIAELVGFVVNLPERITVQEMSVFPTAQRSARDVYRAP